MSKIKYTARHLSLQFVCVMETSLSNLQAPNNTTSNFAVDWRFHINNFWNLVSQVKTKNELLETTTQGSDQNHTLIKSQRRWISHTPNFRSKMDLLTLLKDCRLQTFRRHSSTDYVCITCLRWTQPCAWKQNIFHGLFASSWMTVHLHRRTRVLLLFLMPIRTFLAIASAIFLNTFVPSLSFKNSHHGEKNRNQSGSCMKPGTGIMAQSKALIFKTHYPIELREQLQLSLLC